MAEPVSNFLSEKFKPNLLPEVYAPRRALLGAFHRAAEERFVYVCAPAGSGKTVSTLLWLRDCGRKAVWIGLDQYDSAPSVFYKQLAMGLYSLQPDNEAMKSVLMSPDFSASPVEHTVRLISEMQPDDGQYALVLDDMHLVTNGEVIKALPAVLRRLPFGFVTLILSRHDLPGDFLPLVKDRRLMLITADDLRFTKDEIRRYFGSLGRFLTVDEARAAFLATDGWAMGVNAIAQSGEIEFADGKYDFTHYFETQLWNKWKPELRDFCLKTAVVDEFDPTLAAALAGCGDAEKILEHLSRTNSFLSRLHGETYRYHHLFQDFLREKLLTSGLDTAALHKIAANFYREQGDYTRALRFWLSSGDYKGTDNFLYLFLFENNRGVIADYADFLRPFFRKEFPAEAYREFPPLHVLSAWYYYITSQHGEFAAHMDAIIRNLPRIAKIDSKFAEYSILAYSVDYRTSILTKVKQFNVFGRFVKKYTPEGLATSIASFTHNLPYMHRSNFDYSDLVLDPESLGKIDKTFAPLLGAEWGYIRPGIQACFLYEQNRLPEALAQNTRTLDCLKEESKTEGRMCVLMLQHTILFQLGKTAEADEMLQEISALSKERAQFFLPNLEAYRVKLELFDGDRDAARAWLDNYFVVDPERIELFRVFQHFTTARAYMALDAFDHAKRYLFMLREYGKNWNRPLDEAEACVLLCALFWKEGRKEEAEEMLVSALSLLQPYGFLRVIADEGASILPVLRRIAGRVKTADYDGPLDRGYVNEAMLAAHGMAKQHKGVIAVRAGQDKPVKLSRQQAYMLSLLSQGYKNAEIAELTGLSIPTIKTHTSVAYRKLGVNNAMDAVLKARELNLIE